MHVCRVAANGRSALLNPPIDIDLAGIEPEPCPVGCCVPWLLDCRVNDYLLNYQP